MRFKSGANARDYAPNCLVSMTESRDIGITYGEIYYFVSNRTVDPRGI